jgi:hypothetical protein
MLDQIFFHLGCSLKVADRGKNFDRVDGFGLGLTMFGCMVSMSLCIHSHVSSLYFDLALRQTVVLLCNATRALHWWSVHDPAAN